MAPKSIIQPSSRPLTLIAPEVGVVAAAAVPLTEVTLLEPVADEAVEVVMLEPVAVEPVSEEVAVGLLMVTPTLPQSFCVKV